ncbi:hypothetical protein ScalyP_jg4554 [Parmales sp. scaly parma]|nr:hypothetical protein ScalyP_jg4554 [Parmales sp. scaly parma]
MLSSLVRRTSAARLLRLVAKKTFHSSSTIPAPLTINVPTMGDSITEGTIIEWSVNVGEQVNEGDVIALIETDKVTVDIKADIAGVLMEKFGEVDDNVDVGSPFYVLDGEVTATVEKTAAASSAPATAPAAAPATVPTPTPTTITTPSSSSHRTPSMKFLGKSGWRARLDGLENSATDHFSLEYTSPMEIQPNFGRPLISEAEMEALEIGIDFEPVLKQKAQHASWR